MSDDEDFKTLVAIANGVIDAGVEQFRQADLKNEDPRHIVARIYAAMELTAMTLEQEFAGYLHGAPLDKSKLN